uniref:Uncharacterized protein n=1 Tax=Glycine max TaxID=3847 RepID=C6TNG9_SOYBN|nr:unknown [Glycine max]
MKLLRASLYADALVMYTRCKAGLKVSIPPLAATARSSSVEGSFPIVVFFTICFISHVTILLIIIRPKVRTNVTNPACSIKPGSSLQNPDTLVPGQFATLFDVRRVWQRRGESDFFEIIAYIVVNFPANNPHFHFQPTKCNYQLAPRL